jgi:hypothetical protein
MKRALLKFSLLGLTAGMLLAVQAHADSITLTLAQPSQVGTGHLGGTLSFNATVAAPGSNGAAVFLNGDTFNVGAPLTLDDDGFFLGFPLSLNPGQSFTGLLFTVFLPTTTPSGLYNGTFSILGGANSNAENDVANVSFSVSTIAPEPSSILLLATGLSGLVVMIRRKREATS